ncbi:unnamed protein product [Leptidea sinapis]|uniref:Tyrosine specific protein phosphatases domain-containing protein n=1 Tax=Leptidea sinapis TaxID=189913 RepID=A0A5E4QRM6_9NEOP|nr:unnamed protein product [Leptidea sinapis]
MEKLLEKIPNIGAVIDLTNTSRYYNPKGFVSAGVLHKKIHVQGHVVPPEAKVTEFMNTVDKFLEKDDVFEALGILRRIVVTDSLVGVHCTHGLNRTGYMVCRIRSGSWL